MSTAQPYVSWKGQTFSSVVSSNSRPNTNGPSSDPLLYHSAFGKARPLKLWRKQLVPTANSGSSKSSLLGLDKPGSSTLRSNSDCTTCLSSIPEAAISTSIQGNNSFLTTATPNNSTMNAGSITDTSNNIYDKCLSCDATSNRIKPATTVLSKKYYTSSQSYLRSRCQTYAQKAMIEKRPGIQYVDSNGIPLQPTDANNGPQVFNTASCEIGCGNGKTVTTIYKPNNAKFAQQGAVSSSTRLLRLQQETIDKNGSSFLSAFGQAATNAGKYRGVDGAPYFIKSKISKCNPALYRRNGNPTACWHTPIADMVIN